MRLFLGQSNTIVYIYIVKQSIDRARGFALATEFRFMSCRNYTNTCTKEKTLKGRRECMFQGKVMKTQITVGEELINLLSLIVSREDVLSA